MAINRKCCDPKFDWRKKPRTGSITSAIHRKRRNAVRSGSGWTKVATA